MSRIGWVTVCSILLLAASSQAALVLPDFFGSNMVLQEQREVNFWGSAEPGQTVEIRASWSDHDVTAKADEKGHWKAKVQTPKASFTPYTVKISAGSETLEYANVLVGQVWVCSGQSNMAWRLKDDRDAAKEVPQANFPLIRLYDPERKYSAEPMDNLKGKWAPCDSESAKNFSAVGYYFGKNLFKNIQQPIGLVNISWGGTPAEAWMSPQGLAAFPQYMAILKPYWSRIDQQREEYDKKFLEWKRDLKKGVNSEKPKVSKAVLRTQNKPSYCYNGMLAPFIGYSIAGVIWYQGEANTPPAYHPYYGELFPGMITNWRAMWQQGDFPFFYVQLAASTGYGVGVCQIRQAQMLTLDKVPNVGMAVTMDIGDATSHHPTDKSDVGYRLSLWAMRDLYGQKDLVCSGPLYKSKTVENGKIRVKFNFVGEGLMAKGPELTDWAVCGEDGKFYPAKAVIDGDSVLVSSDKVAAPKQVSYAWCEYAQPNLYNKNGLPASPFNTYELERAKK